MRTAGNRQFGFYRKWHVPVFRPIALALAAIAFGSVLANAQAARTRRKPVAAKKPAAALKQTVAPQAPEVPKPPDWPVNDQPKEATIVWNSHGLRVDASNSSLQQILKDVATATGTKISGLDSDQRIFGAYGPGPARNVLSQLLDGSGYNVLMIGDRGQGTPRQVVLSKAPTGPAPAPPPGSNSNVEDNSSTEVEEPQPQPQPEPPPAAPNNGFVPGAQPRTPQQILQEMQQRQQRIEQMQQQPNANPQ